MDLGSYLAAHHHVIDLATLRAFGLTVRFAEAQIAARRWQRVHPAVFCGYTGPLTFGSRCEAALRLAGEGAVLDAATAATIHGLRGFECDGIEVLVPHGRRVGRRPGLTVRRSRTLTEASVRIRDGLRVVDIDRAVLSIALTRPTVVAAAVQQGLTTPERLRRCLAGLGHVPGRRGVLEALDDVDSGCRSWLESRFRQLIRSAGLPLPVQNHPLTIGGRKVWLDACYVMERIAIELDGRAYHVDGEAWASDLRRQNAIVLDGWLVLRFTAEDVRERPDDVVAAVRRALRIAGPRSATTGRRP